MKLFNSRKAKESEDPQAESAAQPGLLIPREAQLSQSMGKTRSHMEDSAIALTFQLAAPENKHNLGLYMVADGMGGHLNGEVASKLAVQTVSGRINQSVVEPLRLGKDTFSDEEIEVCLTEAMDAAQKIILNTVSGGGTTLSLALILDQRLHIAHVGDSRVYLWDGQGSLRQLTRDHSLVRRLIDLGEIDARDAASHPQRNVLIRALGQTEGFKADILHEELSKPGLLLLCSDGLWGQVTESELVKLLTRSASLQEGAQALVRKADLAGGIDNVSVILVRISE